MTAIYKITNRLNRKIYVGLTYRSIERRFLEHSKANTPLGQAMRECGLENFMIEIIEECETLELAKKREQFWIKILNCKVPNGYNQSDGGEIGYSRKPKMQIVKPVFLASPVSDFASRLKDLRCKNSFGQRVRKLRLASGMTQGQLGEAVGITKQGIQAIESGRRDTTLPRIISIADFFDVDANYLLGRVQTPDSLVIEELAYDNGTLFVHFRNNDWYRYLNVPEDVYERFVAAPSKGKFFLENVMTNYGATRASKEP